MLFGNFVAACANFAVRNVVDFGAVLGFDDLPQGDPMQGAAEQYNEQIDQIGNDLDAILDAGWALYEGWNVPAMAAARPRLEQRLIRVQGVRHNVRRRRRG
jgi:hypothetical protein